MRSLHKYIGALVVGVIAITSTARASEKSSLDEAVLQRAPEILKYLRDQKYKNVGVLKFLVQKGNEAPTDNVGPLNLNFTRRLEVALVLSNPDDGLGIIRNASAAVAESKRRASHLSAPGRTELFAVPYTLAWGGVDDEPVKADGFVTGIVELGPDLATTTVRIQSFGKNQSEPKEICRFSVPTDARTLTEAGRSYRVRQITPKGDAAAKSAKDTEEGKAKHPLDGSNLEWVVYYDTELVPVAFKDGRASVKGPKQGQVVWFVLTNRGAERYGVVLRVNGENTLYREKLPSSLCRKWILDPGDRVLVRGYQSDDKTAAGFQVLSPEESEKEEVNYGEHAGTFSLEVFAARTETPQVAEDDPKVKAVEKGELPNSKPNKLASLQAELMKEHRDPSKVTGRRQIPNPNASGLVVAGKTIESEVRREVFDPAPVPIVSATVRYYTTGR